MLSSVGNNIKGFQDGAFVERIESRRALDERYCPR
jgi:hypothetical protein